MPAAKALNRRFFLAGTTALAIGAVTTAAKGSLPRAAAAQMPGPYSIEAWEPLLGSNLAVGTRRIRLTAVDGLVLGFALSFEVEGLPSMDGIYTVQHPVSGPVDLFMTVQGQHALAVFTHLPEGNI